MDQTKYVYDLSEGDMSMKPLLGGKGAGLADMKKIGVPVPDAFTVTTQSCVDAMNNDGEWPEGLAGQIEAGERRIIGVMVESHLVAGRQDALPGQPLTYGQSITDACLGWGESLTALEVLSRAVERSRAGC